MSRPRRGDALGVGVLVTAGLASALLLDRTGYDFLFLRQRGLTAWAPRDPRRTGLIARRPTTADDVVTWAREVRSSGDVSYPEIAANGALALIAVATSLLDRQIAAQAKAFENEGGFTERLYRVRTARRSQQRRR